jgi:NAD(P)-dependent dehydrogenase (short-subunit alcohol dehydrogenase family)
MNGADREFSGRTAVVTGAARGIGRVISRRLAEQGARVIIADLNDEGGIKAVEELRATGAQADFLQIDLSLAGAGARLIEHSLQLAGRVNILVNNARAGKRLELSAETEANWDLAVTVGLKSAFFAAQAAIESMSGSGGGSVINIASVAAVLATNESPSYHASKAGILQLTRYLAVAAGRHGVRVNCVLPGLIVQDEHRRRFEGADNKAFREQAEFYQPLGRVGSADDVAEAVLFLSSQRSRYISGASLVLDGGATVQEQFGMLLRRGVES